MTAVFLFFYFLFPFFTKIYFRFGNLQKYTPAAPLPGGRDLAARLGGGRPPPPLYKGVGCPSPSFALLKIHKKEKRGKEGEEG